MRAILRVDDRLLHGKLAISWTSYLKTDTILIANENAVNDEFTMMSLRLAKPRNVQIIIQDIPDAIAYLRENSESERRILVVVKKIVDALPLLEAFSFFTSLNIGGLRSRNAKIEISPAIFLNEADLAICKELSRTIEIYFQEIPEHPKIHFQDLQISESRQI